MADTSSAESVRHDFAVFFTRVRHHVARRILMLRYIFLSILLCVFFSCAVP